MLKNNNEKFTNEEFRSYLKKVMWYAEQEYEIPAVDVDDFEKSPYSNVILGHCFTYFTKSDSFQNCACSLVEYMKNFANLKNFAN